MKVTTLNQRSVIAARQTLAADVEFSGNSDGHRLQITIKHVKLRIEDWAAYRQRVSGVIFAVALGNLKHRRSDARLTRTVGVDEPDATAM